MNRLMARITSSQKPSGVRWQAVALPAEHGGWSLVIEPILVGLLVAPTWGGLCLGLAGFFAFLAHQPVKISLLDRKRGRAYARTQLAARFAFLYLGLGIVFLGLAVWLVSLRPLLPLALAVPLMLIFGIYDQRPGRHWQAELSAPIAFAAIAASIPLAAGWSWPTAVALWVVMAARSAPSILYVRSRLRLGKGKEAQRKRAWLAHLIALVVVAVLVGWNLLPETAVIAMIILLSRALIGLSRYRRNWSTKTLGFVEIGLGLMTVLLVALGYWIQ